MFYPLAALIGVAAAVLGYLALQPGEIRVRRSLQIKRDRADIFSEVRDLRNWREWSPWLLHEPDARLDYSFADAQSAPPAEPRRWSTA